MDKHKKYSLIGDKILFKGVFCNISMAGYESIIASTISFKISIFSLLIL